MALIIALVAALASVIGLAVTALSNMYIASRKRPQELQQELDDLRDDVESGWRERRDCEKALRAAEAEVIRLTRLLAKYEGSPDGNT